ncbi:MAG: hypothetical protein C4341_05445 [Armatimonadota bacterium]
MTAVVSWACLVVSAATAQGTNAQERERRTILVGVDFGAFFPTDGDTQDAFGSTWLRFGLSPLSFQDDNRWKFTFDIAFLHRSVGPNRATLIPATFGVTRGFVDGESATIPYVAARVGPYFGDVRIPSIAVDDQKIGFNANAAVGVSFNRQFYIEARYDVFSDFSGLDFNGFFFTAGFKLFQMRL